MSRLLHRSKSTRELKTRPNHSDEELPSIIAQLPPHTPNKLVRKRAGTIAESKVADMKVVIRNGMVVASPMSPDGNLSVTSLAQKPTLSGPGHFYLDNFQTRSASRISLDSPSQACIGVAIGSPSKEKNAYFDGGRTPDTGHHRSIPSFYLPPEPFDIKGEPGYGGNRTQQEGKGGWRKIFGRSLFGTKKGQSQPSQSQKPQQPQFQIIPQTPAQPLGRNMSLQKHIPITTAQSRGGQMLGRAPQTPKVKHEDKVEFMDWNFSQARKTSTATPPTPSPVTTNPTASKQATTKGSPCLLNVDIPSTEMERYSIMFGAFLQAQSEDNQAAKAEPAQKGTLYDRRKSRDLLANKEAPRLHLEPLKRHATTAGRITPTPKPLISTSPEIFAMGGGKTGCAFTTDAAVPATVTTRKSELAQKPARRLGRSNTTTALTRDPRPGPGFVVISNTPSDFDTFPLPQTATSLHFTHLQPQSASAPGSSLDTRKRSESEVSKVSAESTSSTIATPHGSFEDKDDWVMQKKNDGSNGASAVEVLTSKSNNDLSDAGSWEMVSAKTSPQLQQQPLKEQKQGQQQQRSPTPEHDDAIMAAVEMSIQRQISISQRQLLLPVIKPGGKKTAGSLKKVASMGEMKRKEA